MTTKFAVTIAAAALAAAAFATPAGAVTAVISGSQITSPSDPAYVFGEKGSTTRALTISGTTTGGTPTQPVDINCYDGNGNVRPIKHNVPTSGNAFSVDLPADAFWGAGLGLCILRAVPVGDTTARPPSAAADPYHGPRLAVTYGDRSTWSDNQVYEGYADHVGTGGEFQFDTAEAGIVFAAVYDPTTLARGPSVVDEASGFNGGDLIKVDGHDSYLPGSDYGIPGWIGTAAIHTSLDPATGRLVFESREPLSRASDPPTGSYESAGVELDRTWTTDSDGRVAHLVDTWRSTDNQPHTLQLQYESEAVTAAAGDTLDLPGTAGYHDYNQGDAVSLPSGPGTIYFKYDATTPDGGDGTNPQGALTYESAPDAPASIETTSATAVQWLMPYTRSIAAGGSTTLRFSWSQAFSRSDLESFAQQALASWAPPQQPGRPPQTGSPGSDPSTGPPAPQAQTTVLSLIGAVHQSGNSISFTLACANGPCPGGATVTTTELLKGSRPTGLRSARVKHKQVTVGGTRFTIASGSHKTITVKLNAAGKKLLKKFKKLPAKLTVSLNGRTVVAKKATLKKR